jgi:hypothetical protein
MAKSNEQISELISAYIDGEVTPREREQVESLLKRDPAARRLHDDLRQTSAILAGLPRHAAPPDMAGILDAQLERIQLLSGTEEARSSTASVPGRLTWLKAAASLALVAGAGWWYLSLHPQPTPRAASRTPPSDLTEAIVEVDKPAASEPVEVLLARGAGPTELLSNSFEVEPVRVQVLARSEAEREEIKKNLSTQLTFANAENLAARPAVRPGGQSVGAFYLEGKPGVNFSGTTDRQILVRLPQSQAEQIIDSVTAGGRVPGDQIALKVGAATVRGPENARNMLQKMASNASPAEFEIAPAVEERDAAGPGKPGGLLKTLGEIVGVSTVTSSERSRTQSGESAASDTSAVVAEAPAATGDEKEADSIDPTQPLVARRLEAARTSRASEDSVTTNEPAEVALSAPSSSRRASSALPPDPFITIVIELAVPSPNPTPRNDASRTRS